MIKDFLRRKEIVARSDEIAAEIMARYSMKMDRKAPGESKASVKKRSKKLAGALKFGRNAIRHSASQMGLGIYGKAKLCKSVQDRLLKEGYSEDATRMIIEELAVTI